MATSSSDASASASSATKPYVPGELAGLFGWTKQPPRAEEKAENAAPETSIKAANVEPELELDPKVDVQPEERASPKTEAAKEDADSRTLFVGNVPVRIDGDVKLEKIKSDLRGAFSKYGKIASLRLRSLGVAKVAIPSGSNYKTMRRVSAMKQSLDETTTSCNAYVVYESASSVDGAIKAFPAEGQSFTENQLRVDRVGDSAIFDRRRTVFCGNLPFDVSDETLRQTFDGSLSGEGSVCAVRIVRDRHTNIGKGFGYVLLKSSDMLEAALAQRHRDRLAQDAGDTMRAVGEHKARKQEAEAGPFAEKKQAYGREGDR